MVKKSTQVLNKKGIHVRPSGLIFKGIMGYPGKIIVIKEGVETQVRDIITILSLGLGCGAKIDIIVEGENEEEMCSKLVELFSRTYDFEEQ